MGFDTAYEAINEGEDTGHRWAYGTGFTDPLAGVDTALPAGVDGADLATYCLMLGDDALIMSHRLQQWLARAPELEEETALANIALDLLGQARLLLTRAGAADGSGRTEDDFAFGRVEREFRSVRLAEVIDSDFAALAYHRDYAAQWVVRLGDGTDYSRERMIDGLAAVAPLVPELFAVSEVERRMIAAGVAADPAQVRAEVGDVLAAVLAAAGLDWPDVPGLAGVSGQAGRAGVHTEVMGYLLAELQSIARSLPGAVW
jgi:ring-1,2-phenylacetyl-CoA epoxidase subunit PaaC